MAKTNEVPQKEQIELNIEQFETYEMAKQNVEYLQEKSIVVTEDMVLPIITDQDEGKIIVVKNKSYVLENGGAMPTEYIKSVKVSGDTLEIKDEKEVITEFTPIQSSDVEIEEED